MKRKEKVSMWSWDFDYSLLFIALIALIGAICLAIVEIHRPPKPLEEICAEMQIEYTKGGEKGVSEWLAEKRVDEYPLSRVIACGLRVGKG
jgi:hypothetical protein